MIGREDLNRIKDGGANGKNKFKKWCKRPWE